MAGKRRDVVQVASLVGTGIALLAGLLFFAVTSASGGILLWPATAGRCGCPSSPGSSRCLCWPRG